MTYTPRRNATQNRAENRRHVPSVAPHPPESSRLATAVGDAVGTSVVGNYGFCASRFPMMRRVATAEPWNRTVTRRRPLGVQRSSLRPGKRIAARDATSFSDDDVLYYYYYYYYC